MRFIGFSFVLNPDSVNSVILDLRDGETSGQATNNPPKAVNGFPVCVAAISVVCPSTQTLARLVSDLFGRFSIWKSVKSSGMRGTYQVALGGCPPEAIHSPKAMLPLL
jgi:hypothetical protein